MIEAIALQNGWSVQLVSTDEIALLVRGRSTDYRIFLTWMRKLEVFHLACSFEMPIPETRRSGVQRLIGCINEHLWIGHFDLWMDDGTILFRQSLLLVDGDVLSNRQCEAMIRSALDICDHYYPALRPALTTESLVETSGSSAQQR